MKRTYFKRSVLAGGLILATGLLATQSASAALITQWGYSINAGWSDATFNGTDNAQTDPGTLFGLPTKLEWGTPFHGDFNPDQNPTNTPSSLVVSDPVGGVMVTNGGPEAGVTVTHNNFIIVNDGNSLDTAQLALTLTLDPFIPDLPSLPPLGPLVLDIQFMETPNNPGSGLCADGNPPPIIEGLEPLVGCEDIFVLQNPGALDDVEFVIDDYVYTLSQDVFGLGPLDPGECTAAGATSPCIGVITEENKVNMVDTTLMITARKIPTTVPEPASLALMGIGILGLGISRRRKIYRS